MSDLIRVVDLEVFAHIGVPEAERRDAQRLLISIEMNCDSFAHAAGTDNVAWTINYADVVAHVKKITAHRARKLLETLAEEIATDLLKAFPIKRIAIEIKKFVLPDTQYVSVKIERGHAPLEGRTPSRP
jgi:dihydroneopterin aldolase